MDVIEEALKQIRAEAERRARREWAIAVGDFSKAVCLASKEDPTNRNHQIPGEDEFVAKRVFQAEARFAQVLVELVFPPEKPKAVPSGTLQNYFDRLVRERQREMVVQYAYAPNRVIPPVQPWDGLKPYCR
jgi:hypothetical protein